MIISNVLRRCPKCHAHLRKVLGDVDKFVENEKKLGTKIVAHIQIFNPEEGLPGSFYVWSAPSKVAIIETRSTLEEKDELKCVLCGAEVSALELEVA